MNNKAKILTIAERIESIEGQTDALAMRVRMVASQQLGRIIRGSCCETVRDTLASLLEQKRISETTQAWLNDRVTEESCLRILNDETC